MAFLAHRGLWRSKEEQNSLSALRAAAEAGFGIETDVRDRLGELVIAHDPAHADSVPLTDFLRLYQQGNSRVPLAINIKADGLAGRLKALLAEFHVENYFVFDMSVPDTLVCSRQGLRVFVRASEYEDPAALLGLAAGVWLDELNGPWINNATIERYLASGKEVCLVSPELHGRDHGPAWQMYQPLFRRFSGRLSLCTDNPGEAKAYLGAG